MEVSNPQRFENFSIYINSSMKYLTILLIVLLTSCSKAPDILERILEKARILQEQQKGLTDSEKELIKDADNKDCADVDKENNDN